MFLLVNKKTGEQKRMQYPRIDKLPVKLDKDLELYIIHENYPSIKENQYYSPLPIELTKDIDSEYPVNVAMQNYDVIDVPSEVKDTTIDDIKEAIVIVAKEKKDRTNEEELKLIEITNKIKTNEKTIVNSVNTDVRIK